LQATSHYNYIIAGTGCAGLSLVMRMLKHPFFENKKILLIDKENKNTNDRTWCFWEKEANFFESCVSKKWETLTFKSNTNSTQQNIAPYAYKLIRSKNFYAHCFESIKKAANVEIINGLITQIDNKATTIVVDNITYSADKIFSSILLEDPVFKDSNIYLLQHFKGYFIETNTPVFNPAMATLMDFSVSQKHGATFFYTLPFSATTAIVEYTLFTENLLEETDYKESLNNYISNDLKIADYTITEEEFGIIPMTNYNFDVQKNNTYFIGTAGGATKASSGYTFTFIQKQSEAIINSIVDNKPVKTVHKLRYQFFDDILLYLIQTKKLPLDKIFARLFAKNKMPAIFKFLDEEANILENIRLCASLQIPIFLRAALQRLFRKK
jgi:lycopene beta-cyclase